MAKKKVEQEEESCGCCVFLCAAAIAAVVIGGVWLVFDYCEMRDNAKNAIEYTREMSGELNSMRNYMYGLRQIQEQQDRKQEKK